MRAGAMLSAIPCIATLIELHEEVPEDLDSESGIAIRGRVLLQNDLSLAYWGKLSSTNQNGKESAVLAPPLGLHLTAPNPCL